MKMRFAPCLVAMLLAAAVAANAEDKPKAAAKPAAPPSQEEMMKAWMAVATPGDAHKKLEPLAGSFTFTNRMWMDPSKPPEETTGTAEHKWTLDGRFLEERVEGTAMGQPFHGIGYMGYDNYKKKYVGTWMDTMGTMIMQSTGTVDASGKVFTTWSTMDDVVMKKPMKIKGVTTVVDPDHFNFEMWGPGPGREDVQERGDQVHPEEVAQSLLRASSAGPSAWRRLKKSAHGSRFFRRAAKFPIVKSSARREGATSLHARGVETGAWGRRRTE